MVSEIPDATRSLVLLREDDADRRQVASWLGSMRPFAAAGFAAVGHELIACAIPAPVGSRAYAAA